MIQIEELERELERELDKLDNDPFNPIQFLEVGSLLYQMKDLTMARKFMDRAHQLDHKEEGVVQGKALAMYKDSLWEGTAFLLETVKKHEPSNKSVRYWIGDCYFMLGRYEQALRMYDEEWNDLRMPLFPSTIPYFQQEQLLEITVWQALCQHRIRSLDSVHILIVSNRSDKLTRMLLNWGASSSSITTIADGSLWVVHPSLNDSFDLIIIETFSGQNDTEDIKEQVAVSNRFRKDAGLMIHIHYGEELQSDQGNPTDFFPFIVACNGQNVKNHVK